VTCNWESEHEEQINIEDYQGAGIIYEDKWLTPLLAEIPPATHEHNKLQVVGVEKCILKKVKEEKSTTTPDEDPKTVTVRTYKIGVDPETFKLQVNI